MNKKITCFNSVILTIVKEIRLERNMHQAVLAEICGKTISAWNKIEGGKSPLSMELFCRICNALVIPPSIVLRTAEQYANLLYNYHYVVLYGELENSTEDSLLEEVRRYYISPGFKRRQNYTPVYNWNISIINTPYYDNNGYLQMHDVFKYVTDHNFKEEQDGITT